MKKNNVIFVCILLVVICNVCVAAPSQEKSLPASYGGVYSIENGEAIITGYMTIPLAHNEYILMI